MRNTPTISSSLEGAPVNGRPELADAAPAALMPFALVAVPAAPAVVDDEGPCCVQIVVEVADGVEVVEEGATVEELEVVALGEVVVELGTVVVELGPVVLVVHDAVVVALECTVVDVVVGFEVDEDDDELDDDELEDDEVVVVESLAAGAHVKPFGSPPASVNVTLPDQ
jgi:hypothetical protein